MTDSAAETKRLYADLPDAAWRRSFRRRLLAWYDRHARDLPWRRARDLYSVWVSEIMLQQTQVATVVPYFERFMKTFPTVESLAMAEEHDVLRLWEGLGYYRRARQLHQAAQVVVRQHEGKIPRGIRALRELPGIGRYTAGAILSIGLDQRQPILEANTIRLFSRLLAHEEIPTTAASQRRLWAMAEIVLPRKHVGRFNQALMELGSEVCVNGTPRCEECTVAPLCEARREGRENHIPTAKRKKSFESVREAAVLIRRRGRLLLVKCAPDQRWAGLWDFPRFAIASKQSADVRRELIEKVRRLTGVTVAPGQRLATIKHGVTRFRITLDGYEADFVEANGKTTATAMKWLRPNELENYPLSTTGRKLSRLADSLFGR